MITRNLEYAKWLCAHGWTITRFDGLFYTLEEN